MKCAGFLNKSIKITTAFIICKYCTGIVVYIVAKQFIRSVAVVFYSVSHSLEDNLNHIW